MKLKLIAIALYLLPSEYTYSQNVLIDSSGDTLVTITIKQMDNIYTELIEKDRLIEQSEISLSKELKYIELLDSSEKDINTLKIHSNLLQSDYSSLSYMYEKKQEKIKTHRKVGVVMLLVIVLQVILR